MKEKYFIGRLPNGKLAVCCTGRITDKEYTAIKIAWELATHLSERSALT